MKTFALTLIAGAAVAATMYTPAMASGGCGPYGHRDGFGYCRPGPGFGYGYGPRFGFYAGPRYGYGWHRPYGWHRWHRWG